MDSAIVRMPTERDRHYYVEKVRSAHTDAEMHIALKQLELFEDALVIYHLRTPTRTGDKDGTS